METIFALLALCEGNSPALGEFPSQRPVTRNFDVFFDLRLNKRLSIPSRRHELRRHRAHCGVTVVKPSAAMNSRFFTISKMLLCFRKWFWLWSAKYHNHWAIQMERWSSSVGENSAMKIHRKLICFLLAVENIVHWPWIARSGTNAARLSYTKNFQLRLNIQTIYSLPKYQFYISSPSSCIKCAQIPQLRISSWFCVQQNTNFSWRTSHAD